MNPMAAHATLMSPGRPRGLDGNDNAVDTTSSHPFLLPLTFFSLPRCPPHTTPLLLLLLLVQVKSNWSNYDSRWVSLTCN